MKRLSLTAARTRSSRSVDSTTTWPGVRLLDRLPRHQVELQRQAERRPGDHPAAAVDDHRLRQRAQRRLHAQQLVERRRVAHQRRRLAVEVVGHGEGLGADALPMLAQIGLRHRARSLDGGAHPLAEPGLDAEVEEQRREHRDQDRRRHRDQAEQDDDAHVQARSRRGRGGAPPRPGRAGGRRSRPAAAAGPCRGREGR